MVDVSIWGGGSYDPYTEQFDSLEAACVEYARRMTDKWWPMWGSDAGNQYVITAGDIALIRKDVEAVARRAAAADEAAIR
jgi:hypothetical protein